jgi:hypothetical protein
MLKKQATKMALSNAKGVGKFVEPVSVAIKGALGNQRERPGDGIRCSLPGCQIGSRLRAAAQTRSKPCILCCGCGTKELAMLEFGGSCRTDWAAIDAGRRNADKDQTVEPGIPAFERAITSLTIGQFHVVILAFSDAAYSRFSDMVINLALLLFARLAASDHRKMQNRAELSGMSKPT